MIRLAQSAKTTSGSWRLGFLNHESSKKSLPYGGWTYYWAAIRTRVRTRRSQADGATTCFHSSKNNLCAISARDKPAPQTDAITKMMGAPVEAFICPTRRPVRAYPGGAALNGGTNGMLVAKTDYAANGGSVMHPARANTSLFLWAPETNMTVDAAVAQLDQGTSKKWPNTKWCNGIMCESIGIQLRQITDGASPYIDARRKVLESRPLRNGQRPERQRSDHDRMELRLDAVHNRGHSADAGSPRVRL